MVFSSCAFCTPAAACAGRCRAPGFPPPGRRRPRGRPGRRAPARAALLAGAAPLRATMMRPKSSGRCMRRVDLHHALLRGERMAPTGRSWFSLRTAVDHLVGADAQRFHVVGLQVDVDLALDAADQRHRADAAHVFQPLLQHLVGPVGEFDRAASACRLRWHRAARRATRSGGWPDRSAARAAPSLRCGSAAGRRRPFRARPRPPCGRRRAAGIDDDHRLAF